jgi:hypothetical protein
LFQISQPSVSNPSRIQHEGLKRKRSENLESLVCDPCARQIEGVEARETSKAYQPTISNLAIDQFECLKLWEDSEGFQVIIGNGGGV